MLKGKPPQLSGFISIFLFWFLEEKKIDHNCEKMLKKNANYLHIYPHKT